MKFADASMVEVDNINRAWWKYIKFVNITKNNTLHLSVEKEISAYRNNVDELK